PRAKMYEQIAKLPEIEKTQAPKERIQTIEQIGAKFIQCLYEGELTPACVAKAETIASSLVECLEEEQSAVKHLSVLADHDYYPCFPSGRVAAYAVAIAIGMGQRDTNQLKAIALGGIFHDIGKKNVPLSVINKAGPLTEAEWKMMKSHPEQGH